MTLLTLPSLGCTSTPLDPANLSWQPSGELCHPEVLECVLGGSHAERERCAASFPNEADAFIQEPGNEELDCVNEWQKVCRARVPDEPAPLELLDEPNGRVNVVLIVPRDGLPVESLGVAGDWVRVRIESGTIGWVKRWNLCAVYLGSSPF